MDKPGAQDEYLDNEDDNGKVDHFTVNHPKQYQIGSYGNTE